MNKAVKDLVLRMTGGNAAVAEICESAVACVEKGDVCMRLDEGEKEALSAEPSVACFVDGFSGEDSGERPFVVCGDLLYTRRNWRYERNVASRIAAMSANVSAAGVDLPADEFYSRLRGEQREAVAAMCRAQFTILTGGPGTGKTHTIARAVRFLQETRPGLRLALAAPTGKAAARMTESMSKAGFDVSEPATTIHSLLVPQRDFVNFIHGRDNPLAMDWLIVDEASMIDLPLMSKLLDDVGVVMPDEPKVLYLQANGGLRSIWLELLPATELAFATTIHKSQGSEFDDVAIVMPPDGESPLLTREILYTGITRTKGTVRIYAGTAAIKACCEKSVERATGLC